MPITYPVLLTIIAVLSAFSLILYRSQKKLLQQNRTMEKDLLQREKYRGLVENASSIIIRWDTERKYTFLNEYAERFFGYNHQELLGKPVIGTTVPRTDASGKSLEIMLQDILVNPDRYTQNVNEVITKDKKRFWMQWSNNPIFDEEGNIQEILSIGIDITEKKRAEQAIEASLREKEILLKEIHHRVKNNLQIVSSLLNLQSLQISDDRVLKFFTASRNRIHSMALVHEKLYQSENLSRINFKEYIKDLTMYLFDSYDVDPTRIKPFFSLQEVNYPVDVAIPCALIVHELVANALQHAFPDNREGSITITLKEENHETCLTVHDNGIGLPNDTAREEEKNLGIQLVRMLSDQLKGSTAIDRTNGTAFSFTFVRTG